MNVETEITMLAASELNARYDAECKALFQNREILAPLLQSVVPEYRGMPIDEIVACIPPGSITEDAVDDTSVAISRLPEEESSMTEKLIRYDVRFRALNPRRSDRSIQFFLHFDVEVQNSYHPKNPAYPIIKRAIYYAAREISSQLGILTETTDYNKLEKAYSLWICNEDIPLKLQNTVTAYHFTKEDLICITDEPAVDFDLMSVILIRRGKETGTQEIFDYLQGIFDGNLETLNRYIDISDNEAIKERVSNVSGMGASIAKRNYDQGISQGLKALVVSLSAFVTNPADILAAVRKNDIYKDVTIDDIKECIN